MDCSPPFLVIMATPFPNDDKELPHAQLQSRLGFSVWAVLESNALRSYFFWTGQPIKSFNSPIVKLEPEKGFFLITIDAAGILWVQVEEFVKEYLKTLEVGDLIDVVVDERPNHAPPILKS